MNLADIRQKFPQYEDMSDEQLVKGFHAKFYSDMPIEDFKSKLGMKTEFSVGEMVSNIPSSAAEFGKNVIQPFLHPIDTAKGMVNLAAGVGDKAAQTYSENVPPGGGFLPGPIPIPKMAIDSLVRGRKEAGFDKAPIADAMGQFYKDRYGSMDNLKKTVMKDPVGSLADASALFTAGGSAMAGLPGRMGKMGATAKRIGVSSEPLNLAKNTVKTTIANSISKKAPVNMYESAAKFSTTFPKAKRQAMAETALKHKIMPTARGLDKLDSKIGKLTTEIDGLIDDATKAGKTIPKKALFKSLKESRQKVGGVKLESDKDLRQLNRVAKEFDIRLKKIKKDSLTPREVQEIKTDAYKLIDFDARQLRSQRGTTEARKSIARSAKQSIEGVVPVKEPNKILGELLQIKDPLTRSAARIENRNLVSIDAPVKIAAGSAGGAPGMMAGLGSALFDHPRAKAKLAITLNELQKKGAAGMLDPRMMPALIGYSLLTGGRLDDATSNGPLMQRR